MELRSRWAATHVSIVIVLVVKGTCVVEVVRVEVDIVIEVVRTALVDVVTTVLVVGYTIQLSDSTLIAIPTPPSLNP